MHSRDNFDELSRQRYGLFIFYVFVYSHDPYYRMDFIPYLHIQRVKGYCFSVDILYQIYHIRT